VSSLELFVWSTNVQMNFFSLLVNKNIEIHFWPRWHVWSTHVIYFVSSLSRDGFGKNELRYNICNLRHWVGFLNMSTFCVRAVMGTVRSSKVEMYFVSSLAYEWFS